MVIDLGCRNCAQHLEDLVNEQGRLVGDDGCVGVGGELVCGGFRDGKDDGNVLKDFEGLRALLEVLGSPIADDFE